MRRVLAGPGIAFLVAVVVIVLPQTSRSEAERPAEQAQGGTVPGPPTAEARIKGWTPGNGPPPTTPEEAVDPRVAAALEAAPPWPATPPAYVGRGEAMKAARNIRARVPRFYRFRSAIPLATWHVDDSHSFRIRPARACYKALRQLKVRAQPYEPDPADPVDVFPTPAPVTIKGRIGGVYFSTFRDQILVSCELASRLPAVAKILAEHDVSAVVIASSYRPRPKMSFHSLGMGLDIPAFRTKTALPGPDGRLSKRLLVKTDFLETPNKRTCDPTLLGPSSPHGKNERGRRLLSIACKLFEAGALTSVLTPNYNKGHRDHFHVDIRPDDPRAYIR